MWGNFLWQKCTHPTLQTHANMRPPMGDNANLTTCIPLFELPPLILRCLCHKHLRRWCRKCVPTTECPPPPPAPLACPPGISPCERRYA